MRTRGHPQGPQWTVAHVPISAHAHGGPPPAVWMAPRCLATTGSAAVARKPGTEPGLMTQGPLSHAPLRLSSPSTALSPSSLPCWGPPAPDMQTAHHSAGIVGLGGLPYSSCSKIRAWITGRTWLQAQVCTVLIVWVGTACLLEGP